LRLAGTGVCRLGGRRRRKRRKGGGRKGKRKKKRRTSWTISWTQRSNPQSPTLLAIVPPTKAAAATVGIEETQNPLTAAATQIPCQLINHNPALMGPTREMAKGASQVADISKPMEIVRIRLMESAV
jgi:hypothetical protein